MRLKDDGCSKRLVEWQPERKRMAMLFFKIGE